MKPRIRHHGRLIVAAAMVAGVLAGGLPAYWSWRAEFATPRVAVDYHYRDDATAERRVRRWCDRTYCEVRGLDISTKDAPGWASPCFGQMSRLRGTTGIVQSSGWPIRSHSWHAVSASGRMPIHISDRLSLPMHFEEIAPGRYEGGSAPDRLYAAVEIKKYDIIAALMWQRVQVLPLRAWSSCI